MAKGRKRRKRMPQRTCVACREVQGKRELVRIVRTPPGDVEVDLTGKRAGRGAYLCRTRECWERALAQRQLDRALKTRLSEEEREKLTVFAQVLPEVGDPTRGELRGSEAE